MIVNPFDQNSTHKCQYVAGKEIHFASNGIEFVIHHLQTVLPLLFFFFFVSRNTHWWLSTRPKSDCLVIIEQLVVMET